MTSSAPETKATEKQLADLKSLAQLQGVQTQYHSAFGTDLDAAPSGIVRVMNAFGISVKDDLSNVSQVLQKQTKEHWQTVAEPIVVFWENKKAAIPLRLSAELRKRKADLKIELENGEKFRQSFNLGRLPVKNHINIEGTDYWESALIVKRKFPLGYHQATISIGSKNWSVLIISAPLKAYKPKTKKGAERICGVFSPLYALHSEQSWGIGDFSDLGNFIDWIYSLDCDFVGTLPMLAVFNDKPMVEPSPYSPVSRVFWNELYLDPCQSAEWQDCLKAQRIMDSAAFTKEQNRLQSLREVDYQGVSRLKRKVLEALAEEFFSKKKDRSPEFREFIKWKHRVVDYAEFRATCDKTNKIWQKWPERMRNGKLQPGDYLEKDKHYHLYCQFLAHQQLSALSEYATQNGRRGIYLDFPLSAHPSGYDVWREKEAFVHSCSAGCPPDPAHSHGQDWGIAPLNPLSSRYNGYRYFRACLENHMRYAGFLRLDHVMCFYRLFWVPKGVTAKEGVYVRYKMDEFFALLTLESQRNKCTLIGEDLGTVPPEIREAMTKHDILRMYCQQRRLAPNPKAPFAEVPPNCICSLNTHDMPPFAAFWKGYDIEDKMKLGYFGPKQMREKKKDRAKAIQILLKYLRSKKLVGRTAKDNEIKAALRGMLLLTAGGPAQVMQVNVEDLWQEVLSQNVPGTWKERPNWKRKLKFGLESFGDLKDIPGLFWEITQLRRSKQKYR